MASDRTNPGKTCGHSTCDPKYGCSRIEKQSTPSEPPEPPECVGMVDGAHTANVIVEALMESNAQRKREESAWDRVKFALGLDYMHGGEDVEEVIDEIVMSLVGIRASLGRLDVEGETIPSRIECIRQLVTEEIDAGGLRMGQGSNAMLTRERRLSNLMLDIRQLASDEDLRADIAVRCIREVVETTFGSEPPTEQATPIKNDSLSPDRAPNESKMSDAPRASDGLSWHAIAEHADARIGGRVRSKRRGPELHGTIVDHDDGRMHPWSVRWDNDEIEWCRGGELREPRTADQSPRVSVDAKIDRQRTSNVRLVGLPFPNNATLADAWRGWLCLDCRHANAAGPDGYCVACRPKHPTANPSSDGFDAASIDRLRATGVCAALSAIRFCALPDGHAGPHRGPDGCVFMLRADDSIPLTLDDGEYTEQKKSPGRPSETERSSPTAGDVLVVHSGKVLAVTNRRYGGVSLPGGKAEPSERTIDAAIRELREETNLTVRAEDLVLVANGSTAGLEERNVSVFLARHTTGFAKSVEPGTNVSWLRWDELLARSPFEGFYREHFTQGVAHFRDTGMLSRCTCRVVGLNFPGMPGGGFYTGDCTYHKP